MLNKIITGGVFSIFLALILMPANLIACGVNSNSLQSSRKTRTCSGTYPLAGDYGVYQKYNKYNIIWSDSANTQQELQGQGECQQAIPQQHEFKDCEAFFHTPTTTSASTYARLNVMVDHNKINIASQNTCIFYDTTAEFAQHTCRTTGGTPTACDVGVAATDGEPAEEVDESDPKRTSGMLHLSGGSKMSKQPVD